MYNQIDSNKRRTWALIIIFIAIVLGLGWFIGYYFNYGPSALVLAAIVSLVMTLFSYYGGDKVALWSAKAQLVEKTDNPYICNMVENLCITAGLPSPKVYVIPEEAINAFATGRDPRHASIAVTAGAINRLENEELEGVIAHELSHVKNYDIRLMTIVIVLVGMISIMADFFFRGSLFGVGRKDDNNSGANWLMIVGIILIILSPIIAQLIQLAVSRRREYLADASGALLTRYPEGLARALEKISADPAVLSSASTATAHMYISNPFKGSGKFLARAFSTHPPVEDRIKKLRAMA
ncbi:MAG: M48 family metalloprotease [Candidatus Buchananbacteria bacterium]|jgi:heat shock protein HtpX